MTLGLVPEGVGVYVVAALETAIGLSLLTGRLLRLGLTLLGVAMVGILSHLVLPPAESFRGALDAPTRAGQCVLEDVEFLAAGPAVAAIVLGRRPMGHPPLTRRSARFRENHQ